MIQPILAGVESVATDLSVFLNSSESSYDTYIGVALLERVSINPEDLSHKMLVGRLYNAGAKLCDLHEAFGHDNRTVKKWANALVSGDIDTMVAAFSGRGYNKKRSPEMIRYMHQLYRSRDILGKNYRELIIQMTEEVFAVKISPSLASAIFKGASKLPEQASKNASPEDEIVATTGQLEMKMSSTNESPVQDSPIFPFLNMNGFTPSGGKVLVRHVGLALFGLWLRFYRPIERQFICQLLQGAVNIEQSKSICHRSPSFFSKNPVAGLHEQRKAIDHEATKEKNRPEQEKEYRPNDTEFEQRNSELG